MVIPCESECRIGMMGLPAILGFLLFFDKITSIVLIMNFYSVSILHVPSRDLESYMYKWRSDVWDIYTDSGFLRTLDSSIKRNTAVIKKLKQINDDQRDGLMDELKSVNLSKFVSEAVAAICDAKLRTSDIQAAVQVRSIDIYIIWTTSCGYTYFISPICPV